MFEIAGLASALLLAGSTAPADAGANTAKPEDKLICRKYLETGSLVKSKRVCHTRADWARINDAARKNGEELQDARNGTRGN